MFEQILFEITAKTKTMATLLKNLMALSIILIMSGCSNDDALKRNEDVDNTAPTASSIRISGNLEYGEGLTVSFSYTDDENDTEGNSKTQWYRTEDANGTNKIKIDGGTSTIYTVKVADIGRYLSVEITPIATTGTAQGAAVTSPYTAEITADIRTSYTAKNYNKVVAGFYPSWKSSLLPITAINWDDLTHVIYSFAIPENDGGLNVDDLSNMSDFVSTAHANGVEAFFSIGGAIGSEGFIALSANQTLRNRFVEQVETYAYINNYDGVDIDWEGWGSLGTFDADESQGLRNLLNDLKNALTRHDIKISMDVFPTDWGGKHYTTEMFEHVDWVHIMAYDFEGGWSAAPAHHASLANANQALNYWGNTRGLSKNKMVLGVAFYGKNFSEPSNINGNTVFNVAYRDILASNPNAHLNDQDGNIYYTGMQTIKDKATLIANDSDYLGAMIWEIAHDTPDESKSLLRALNTILNP
ncbi:MAG: GH18 family chitinase [Maribacter sp.]|jgi:GH18 family chitinase